MGELETALTEMPSSQEDKMLHVVFMPDTRCADRKAKPTLFGCDFVLRKQDVPWFHRKNHSRVCSESGSKDLTIFTSTLHKIRIVLKSRLPLYKSATSLTMLCLFLMLAVFASMSDPQPVSASVVFEQVGDNSFRRSISFHKVEWGFDNFEGPSDWGLVSFDRDRLSKQLGRRRSDFYLNIVGFDMTSGEALWLAQNLYFQAATECGRKSRDDAPRSQMTRYFSLKEQYQKRDASRLKARPRWTQTLDVIVVASSHPAPLTVEILMDISRNFRKTTVDVTPIEINAEGHIWENAPLARGNVGPAPPPFTLARLRTRGNPINPSTNFVSPKCIFQEETPNVQCARNQCVPMAVANTLQWLEDKYNSGPFFTWSMADDHEAPGYGKTVDNITWVQQIEESFPRFRSNLISEIDTLTRRLGTTSFNDGDGSSHCKIYDGMFGYLSSQGLDAEFRHQGEKEVYGDGGSCDNDNHGTLKSTRDGDYPTWDWIYQELDAGNGVFLVFGRHDTAGNRTSGHVLRVQGACRPGGIDTLYLLDDQWQGSTGTRLTDGLMVTPYWVEDTQGPGNTAPDNQLNMDGSSWEIEFVQSIRPILKPVTSNVQAP